MQPDPTQPLHIDRHEAFAHVLAAGKSAREAGQLLGYKDPDAVLQRREVRERAQAIRMQALTLADITPQRVLLELGRLATTDVRRLYRSDGTPVPIHELDDDTAAAVGGVEIETTRSTRGRPKRLLDEDGTPSVDLATGEPLYETPETRTVKVKLRDKAPALGLLAKHFKLVGDEGDGLDALAGALAARLKAAARRVEAEVIDVEATEPRAVAHELRDDELAG